MTIMQEDASPEMGLGQVSRPWLTPNLHLAPGSRGGGYLRLFVSGSPQSWTSMALVSSASFNSACERVERTDGVGQFPPLGDCRTVCRSPAFDWLSRCLRVWRAYWFLDHFLRSGCKSCSIMPETFRFFPPRLTGADLLRFSACVCTATPMRACAAEPGVFLCSSNEILRNFGRVTSSEVARSGSCSNRLAPAPFQIAGTKRLWEMVQTKRPSLVGLRLRSRPKSRRPSR